MSSKAVFKGVHPIGDTDTTALPVRSIGPAIGYYTQVLGFSVVSKEKERAVLQRDEATIAHLEEDSTRGRRIFSLPSRSPRKTLAWWAG